MTIGRGSVQEVDLAKTYRGHSKESIDEKSGAELDLAMIS
jgi:hypothetical protein